MKNRLLLLWIGASAALLVLLCTLQLWASPVLQLPGQWLWVALVPTVLGLVVLGYVGKVEVGDLKFELDPLVEAVPEALPAAAKSRPPGVSASAVEDKWLRARQAEKDEHHNLFLAHQYKKSDRPGQTFDAYIYVVRHIPRSDEPQKVGLSDISKAEVYFGDSWGNKVFTVVNDGDNVLGFRTHAFGTFLATCRVSFKSVETPPIILSRYIDHEMLGDHARRQSTQ